MAHSLTVWFRLSLYCFWIATGIACSNCLYAQTANSNYTITYGGNYSSADRKSTVPPGWLTPFSATYSPLCQLTFAVDDDSFVANHTTSGWATGTGNLGFEGHFTPTSLGGGIDKKTGQCYAAQHPSLRFDYVATVPVPSTQESDELSHLLKATYTHYLDAGFYFVNAGANISGVAGGGHTVNAVLSAHYQRPLPSHKTWEAIAEVDSSSSSANGPSSVIAQFSLDKSYGANDTWDLVFGTSIGVTPYAPKVSPFLTLSYNGSAAPSKPKHRASVLKY